MYVVPDMPTSTMLPARLNLSTSLAGAFHSVLGYCYEKHWISGRVLACHARNLAPLSQPKKHGKQTKAHKTKMQFRLKS